MSLLWSKRKPAGSYEVRAAGATRRLYTDGVFHSQYNPRDPVTGGVWDLLALPALFYPAHAVRRVLVLGLGGGAVVRQLMAFVRPAEIVGVELDATHVYVARKFFGLRDESVRLVRADARDWLAAYRGAPFDLIIDDLFGSRAGQPVRAVRASGTWFTLLLRNLTPEGAVVANFISEQEFRACGYFANRRIGARFRSAFRLNNPQEENVVGAFLRVPGSSRHLRRRIRAVPELSQALRSGRLRYRIRTVSCRYR